MDARPRGGGAAAAAAAASGRRAGGEDSSIGVHPRPALSGAARSGGGRRKLSPLARGLLALSLFFVYAAYLQLNDPDPYLWIPAYLAFAWATSQAALRRVSWVVPASCAAASAAWAAGVYGSRTWPQLEGGLLAYLDVEEGREIGGLAVVFFTTAVAALHASRAGGQAVASGPVAVWLGRLCALVAVVCTALALFPPYVAYEKHCGAEGNATAPWDEAAASAVPYSPSA